MQSYVIFENCVFRGKPERRLYLYALLRQPSLLLYAPLYLLADLLSYFFLLPRKKYLAIHYSFLRRVRDPDGMLTAFAQKNRKRVCLPEEGVTVLSAHPQFVVEKLTESPVMANEYSLPQGCFVSWRPPQERIPAGERCRAYGTLTSPVMRRAAEKVYVYGKNRYSTGFACVAGGVSRFAAAMAVLFALCFLWGLLSLYFASQTCPQPMVLFKAYLGNTRLLFLNILPVFLVCLFLYALTGSTAFASGCSGIVTLLLSLINYYKIALRDDPLIFEDIFSFREGAAMTLQYDINLTPRKILLFAGIIAAAVAVRLFFDARIRVRFVRPVMMVCVALLSSYALHTYYFNIDLCYALRNDTFSRVNETLYYGVTDMTRYTASGSMHPLLYSYYSYKMAQAKPPEGYDEQATEALLASYSCEDIPEDKRVHVIGIMLESYSDLSRFDSVELDEDVYAYIHQLRDESYSGYLLTDIYGANTIKTERSFISGFNYYYLPTYRSNANSFAWYMRQQGYRVEGGHPGQRWFYGRQSVNAHMGFEDYFFDEDTYCQRNDGKNNACNDVLFPQILERLDAAVADGETLFSFNVTYEGHGPYSDTEAGYSREYVSNEGLSTEQYHIVNNYMEHISNTNQQIKQLVEELRGRDEPVVLVLFGDHMPALGDGGSVYTALGIPISTDTDEGFVNYYETPYIIWANDAAKEACENDFRGEGETIGPYFLMNELFRLCGWRGNEYMQYLSDFREDTGISALHLYGRYIKDGVLYTETAEEDAPALLEYKSVQYYVKRHFEKYKQSS